MESTTGRFVSECPFCGGTEFIEAYQDAYAALTAVGSILRSEALYHTICRRCGSVVRSYVRQPEKLLKRKDRRSE